MLNAELLGMLVAINPYHSSSLKVKPLLRETGTSSGSLSSVVVLSPGATLRKSKHPIEQPLHCTGTEVERCFPATLNSQVYRTWNDNMSTWVRKSAQNDIPRWVLQSTTSPRGKEMDKHPSPTSFPPRIPHPTFCVCSSAPR